MVERDQLTLFNSTVTKNVIYLTTSPTLTIKFSEVICLLTRKLIELFKIAPSRFLHDLTCNLR